MNWEFNKCKTQDNMRIKKGDELVLITTILTHDDHLTYGKTYKVTQTSMIRSPSNNNVILSDEFCIQDDSGSAWWFEQIGSKSELTWNKYFITKKQWHRDRILKQILE